MIIKPKIRGFVCVTAHPVGCETNVREQIDYVKSKEPINDGPKRVLVIGASTGYGLASRIEAAFGCGAATVGVFLEREATDKRTATAGWYNAVAFEKFAHAEGLYASSINGDAFSDELKSRTVDQIASGMGGVDLVVYSLAAPVRKHPKSGETHRSVLKPLGEVYEGKTLDTDRNEVKDIRIEPASQQEADETVSVMGGEDWEWWIDALDGAGLVADGCRSIAFTYIGDRQGQGGPRSRRGFDRRPAQNARRGCRGRGDEGAGHAGQFGDPRGSSVYFLVVQNNEGKGRSRGVHRAGPAAVRRPAVRGRHAGVGSGRPGSDGRLGIARRRAGGHR
jgi:hypothetical protein